MSRTLVRWGAVGAIYLMGIWPAILFPLWPLWSVWDEMARLVSRAFPAESGALVAMLVTLPALGAIGIMQLLNLGLPWPQRMQRAAVMVLAGIPLGFNAGSGVMSVLDVAQSVGGGGRWVVLMIGALVAVAKGVVLVVATLPLVRPRG